MLRKVFLLPALVLVALLAGRAFWTWLLDNPANFPADVYVAYFQIVDRAIAGPIAMMGTLALLLVALAAGLSLRDRPALFLLAAAFCCLLISTYVTVRYHLPINAQIATFDPRALPPNWPALRDRWWSLHKIRLVVLLAGLGFTSLAALRCPASRKPSG